MLKLRYIGTDRFGRPAYTDEARRLWKDAYASEVGSPLCLCRVSGNRFDGEPDYPLREAFEVV